MTMHPLLAAFPRERHTSGTITFRVEVMETRAAPTVRRCGSRG